jgi:hypothetical protein
LPPLRKGKGSKLSEEKNKNYFLAKIKNLVTFAAL